MKSNEFLSGSEVFLDMDGVLCDFFEEYARLAGNPPDGSGRYNYRNIPAAKTDPTLNKMIGTDFFARLPKFATADQLVSMVTKIFGHYNICSSPLRGDHENSAHHKKVWLQQNLAQQPARVIITPRKEKHATQPDGTPNVLIDDRGNNITAWEAAGGVGIKYQADEDSLEVVVKGLRRAMSIIRKEMPHDPQQLKSRDRSLPVATGNDELKESVDATQMQHFVNWCAEKLHITSALPKFEFQAEKESPEQSRTGYYNTKTGDLWVYTGNRNMIDIMRTVAHELAHHKQREDGDTYHNQDLSDIESQADMAAGMLIKLYVRKFPRVIE
jgi:hypothetical protein